MSKSRNMADLLDSNGDVKAGALDNVASDSISDSGGTARVEATTNGAEVRGTLSLRNGDGNLVTGIKPTRFGYSSSYKVAMLGGGENSYETPSLGFDPSSIASGAFSGNGKEVLTNNGVSFIQPDSTGTTYTSWLTASDGNISTVVRPRNYQYGAVSGEGRIFQASDRPSGSITNQLGATNALFEIVDQGWTKVLLSVDNSGNVRAPHTPAFLAYWSGGNYAMSGALTPNATFLNNGNHFSTSTGRFTAPVNGLYLLSFSTLGWVTYGSGRIGILLNGAHPTTNIRPYAKGDDSQATMTICIYMNAGDYAQPQCDQGTYSAYANFSGHMIG
jgi:hypothetical protein